MSFLLESVTRWGQEIEGERSHRSVTEGKKRGSSVIKSSAISVLESSPNIWGRFGPLGYYIRWSIAILAERVYFPLVPNMLRSGIEGWTGDGEL